MITSGASASTPVEPQADERPWTPGPWRVDPNANCDVQDAAGEWEIASTHPDILRGGVADPMRARANARLIAAAPELAEAAELSLRSFGHAPDAVLVKTFGTDALRSIKALRAALAKARGEA